jgi:POT family proton-dependent oligopeptide transporter
MPEYRSTPVQTTALPRGIPFILGNELAERFSFYGMKGILTVYMTRYLLDASGQPDYMSDEDGKAVYHLFTAAAYFFPILGSLLADIVLGKYRTIMVLSFGYCIGHACIAAGDLDPTRALLSPRMWLFLGMIFIAVGAGGIKPCVSANVGDQFGRANQHLLSKTFSWFYFCINAGAAASTLLTPVLLARVGPWAAFGLPGVLMAIATLIFWLGRWRFVHVPPSGLRRFTQETLGRDGLRAVLNLSPIFLIFIPMFWALFDQTGSAWVLQAERMDRKFLGVEWLESQIQAANPILILTLIPIFAYVVYPAVSKVFPLTPLRKISLGLFLTVLAFSVSSWIQVRIDAGATPSIGWQLLAYVVITAAEVMVSITSLEFAYTQAPKAMKSFIMGIYFLGVSLGNIFTSGVNVFIQNEDGSLKLEGAEYYWFFTGAMAATAVAFVFFAMAYKGRTYIQGEAESFEAEALAEQPGGA